MNRWKRCWDGGSALIRFIISERMLPLFPWQSPLVCCFKNYHKKLSPVWIHSDKKVYFIFFPVFWRHSTMSFSSRSKKTHPHPPDNFGSTLTIINKYGRWSCKSFHSREGIAVNLLPGEHCPWALTYTGPICRIISQFVSCRRKHVQFLKLTRYIKRDKSKCIRADTIPIMNLGS